MRRLPPPLLPLVAGCRTADFHRECGLSAFWTAVETQSRAWDKAGENSTKLMVLSEIQLLFFWNPHSLCCCKLPFISRILKMLMVAIYDSFSLLFWRGEIWGLSAAISTAVIRQIIYFGISSGHSA